MIMSETNERAGSGIGEVRNIVVVGAGAMGSQIGMLCALAGFAATVTDIDQRALDRSKDQLRQRMTRDVEKGRRSADDVDAALERLTFSTDLTAAASTADFVIEAAVEKLDVKRRLFADLDRTAPPHAILATNSSGIVSSRIADATGRPDRVCNLHFFNPALVMTCVEVVRGPGTSDETVDTAVALAQRLGKAPVVLNREIPGFIANRILGAVRDEAIFLLESGIATAADIDTACRTALGYPMGPFELMDLTGIDIGYLTKKDRFAASGDPKDQPSKSVSALVERGELGRKSGRGWYDYDESGGRTARPTEQVTSPPPGC
jgi:3-hydroxybutyryl-CoA dehydrogenase